MKNYEDAYKEANAYKEAVERAEKIYEESDSLPVLSALVTVFPELKDLHFKKTSAEIETFIEYCTDIPDDVRQKWLEWIKTQSCIIDYYEDKMDRLACESFDKGYNSCKENCSEKTCDSYGQTVKNIAALVGEFEERSDFKAFYDKVKLEIKEDIKYDETQSGENCDESSFAETISKETDENTWTIQTAKPGDILATDDGRPFIFCGFTDKYHPSNPVAYCGIDCSYKLKISASDNRWCEDVVKPANKEMREFLFQKIKEAGYEWDGEKNELKRVKDSDSGKQFGLYTALDILKKTLGEITGYQSDDGIEEHTNAIRTLEELYSDMAGTK